MSKNEICKLIITTIKEFLKSPACLETFYDKIFHVPEYRGISRNPGSRVVPQHLETSPLKSPPGYQTIPFFRDL